MNNALDIAGQVAAPPGPAAPGNRVVLVGARRDTRRLVRRLGSRPWSGLPIVGFVDTGHSRSSSMRLRSRHLALHPQTDPVPVLGSIDRLDELVDRARATHVMVAVSGAADVQLQPHVQQLRNPDVAVQWVLVDSSRLDLDSLTPRTSSRTWSLHSGEAAPVRFRLPDWGRLSWGRAAKRLLDISVSALLLAALTPLFALVALAILITSGRPVFYLQERIGQGGRRFRLIKLRSMRCDAERETGPIWASDHDARCTRIGDWLRHTNIDELPQLLNVLRGEMSLVGPRPERPVFVEQFRQTIPDYDLRHAVPCGMTGWAQVHGWRGRTSLRKRIQYDLDYIQRWSIGLDLRILLMTVQHVFWGKTSWNDSKRVGKLREGELSSEPPPEGEALSEPATPPIASEGASASPTRPIGSNGASPSPGTR
jgi:exopolysaccharide biosynthesis polyprenyl glycosylphosphotransferase